MQVKFLGTGGAFDYLLGNASAWLSFRGQHILLDCGNSVYPRLRSLDLADKIDYLLVTHLHDDHVGSLNTTILHLNFFATPRRKARILVPNRAFQDQLAWFISFGMPHPERYVEFLPMDEVPGITAIDTFGLHIKNMQSYGFLFEDEEEIVAYSGDLGDPNILFEQLPTDSPKPKRIFHEMSFHDTGGVHAYYQDLHRHLDQHELYAYHLNPADEPADNRIPLVAHQPELLL